MKSSTDLFSAAQVKELLKLTKVGTWIWYLDTDELYFSPEWSEITGYDIEELDTHIRTWENLLHPDDVERVDSVIKNHLAGENDFYVSEFRLIRKDGSIVWAQDKGRVSSYDKDGNPLVFSGILQDITAVKETELSLAERSNLLDMIINISGFGTWDWNLLDNTITYNAEYMELIGYPGESFTASIEEFRHLTHPDDREKLTVELFDYIEGKSDHFECEVRLKHKNGDYIWTKDIGRIIERDHEGKPTRLVGGHLNINNLKRTHEDLEDALEQLENYQTHLEKQIERRTKSLLEHEKMLLTVNKVSQKLLAITDPSQTDSEIVQSIHMLEEAVSEGKIAIWRNKEVDGRLCFYTAYQWDYDFIITKEDLFEAFDIFGVENLSNNRFTADQKEEFYLAHYQEYDMYDTLDYQAHFPFLYENVQTDKTFSALVKNLPLSEQFFLHFLKVKTLMTTPIYLDGKPWGFMTLFSKEREQLYTEIEENMLRISGSLFAAAILKAEVDEQLMQAHEEALMSSQAKTNFLANMSHEIRTPMNAISGMSEIILRKTSDSDVAEYATGIKTACSSLLAIINDILDISKIESGKLDITETEYSLTSLVNDIVNVARMRLEDKPLLFYTYIDSTLPSKIKGDEIRLKQVLINLLNNAIKFTPSGHVGLRLTGSYCEEKEEVNFDFEIFDSGMGIKEEDMSKLFEEFERVNTTKNRNIEGTGLGLAISKRLCEMMSGTILARSVYGEGSTFTVRIPQKVIENVPFAKVEEKKSVLLYESRPPYSSSIQESIENLGSECTLCVNQSELYENLNERDYDYIFVPTLHLAKVQNLKEKQGFKSRIVLLAEGNYIKVSDDDIYTITLPASALQIANALNNTVSSFGGSARALNFIAPSAHILLVDDNPVNLKVASELMRPYEFSISTAVNGLEAVEAVKNNVYDLVFMDHMMPEMDGIDATIAIRKIQGDYFQNLPIIALTANAIVGTKALFTEEGMDDFLAKPIEVHKLNEILLNWLPKEKIKMLDYDMFEQNQTDTEANTIVIENIDVAYGLQGLGGSLDNYIDILRIYYSDGLKKHALITDYFKQRDTLAFKIEVHAIKSASASIGALDLSRLASALEEAATKGDWTFIEQKTLKFLEDFHAILSSIGEVLQSFEPEACEQKAGNDKDFLKTKLDELTEAVDFVDLNTIETILADLMSYDWGEEIFALLTQIKEAIAAYEYDESLPLIEAIKEKA